MESNTPKKERVQKWKPFSAVYPSDGKVAFEFSTQVKALCGNKGLGVTRVMEWFLKQPEEQQRAILAGLA